MNGHSGLMCFATSKPAVKRKLDSYFICTQNPRHPGDHKACDGLGRVLARWPRSSVERYWWPGPAREGAS